MKIPIPRPRSRRPLGLSPLQLLLALALVPLLLWWGLARASGEGGLSRVADDEVAVVIDLLRGTERVVTTPGYLTHVPWLQRVHKLDRSPCEFRFQGNQAYQKNQAPRLLVRARDGSSFWFDTFCLQYALIPERAAEVLKREGGGEIYKMFPVNAYARSILRDEFGRLEAEEVMLPENLERATRESKRRLNEALQPHGLEVFEVATPQPLFDQQYEQAIERRKVANQKAQHLQEVIDQIEQEREQQRARLARELALERARELADLELEVQKAEREAVRTRRDAEIYSESRIQQGEIARLERRQKAAGDLARYESEVAGLRAQLAALEGQGEVAVRAALVKSLAKIEFTLLPYSRDPAPARVEHEGEGQVRWAETGGL